MKKCAIPVLISGIFLIIIVIMLCVNAGTLGRFFVKVSGSPEPVLTSFLDSIVNGDFDSTAGYTENMKSLGLENDTDNVLLKALTDSYAYKLVGEPRIEGTEATYSVEFTYLNIDKFKANVEGRIDSVILKKIREKTKSELYDEQGQYKEELMNEVYEESLNESIAWASKYYDTCTFDVNLVYKKDRWFVMYNDSITAALLGGRS